MLQFSSAEYPTNIWDTPTKVSFLPNWFSLKEAILQNLNSVSLAIDGSKHSSQVEMFDEAQIQDSNIISAGIDGIMVANISHKREVSLFLLTADCAPIAISSKNGDIIALLHGWWQGIAGWIIQNFDTLFTSQKIQKEDIYIHIWPMVGEGYEFDISDIYSHFIPKLQALWFWIEHYYSHTEIEGKGNLNLRKLIFDIFIFLGYRSQNIFFHPLETNDFHNQLPSHRLHTQAKKIMEKLWWETIPLSVEKTGIPWFENLSHNEKVFFLSEVFELYTKSARILSKVSTNS